MAYTTIDDPSASLFPDEIKNGGEPKFTSQVNATPLVLSAT